MPGGSGGSAAAVAMGAVPVAVVLIPAVQYRQPASGDVVVWSALKDVRRGKNNDMVSLRWVPRSIKPLGPLDYSVLLDDAEQINKCDGWARPDVLAHPTARLSLAQVLYLSQRKIVW